MQDDPPQDLIFVFAVFITLADRTEIVYTIYEIEAGGRLYMKKGWGKWAIALAVLLCVVFVSLFFANRIQTAGGDIKITEGYLPGIGGDYGKTGRLYPMDRRS